MEKQEHKKYYHKFQVSDFDNDLVGLFIDGVVWLREIVKECKEKNIELEEIVEPPIYHKLPPSYPLMDVRVNCRDIFRLNFQYDLEHDVFLANSYVGMFATFYMYNFPVEKAKELILNEEELSRESVLKILVDDGMSMNIHKEPSGETFPKLMI